MNKKIRSINTLDIISFLYIVFFAIIFDYIKLHLNFKTITIIFIFHFLILIPIFIIYEFINGKKTALILLLLFLLPVSLRFILPKSVIIHYEWKRLYKAAAIVLEYKSYDENWEYNWKNIKNITKEHPPVSLVDFKYFKVRENFDESISIYSSSMKINGKSAFLEYNTKTEKFDIVNDENHR